MVDSDHGGCPDTNRSTTGVVVMYQGSCLMAVSRRQGLVTLSTMESELVAVVDAIRVAVWLRKLFMDAGVMRAEEPPTPIYCDNLGAVTVATNPSGDYQRTKHFKIRITYVRELVMRGEVVVKHLAGEWNLADIATKPLPGPRFAMLRDEILGWTDGEEYCKQAFGNSE